jgi:hypothetical protein
MLCLFIYILSSQLDAVICTALDIGKHEGNCRTPVKDISLGKGNGSLGMY